MLNSIFLLGIATRPPDNEVQRFRSPWSYTGQNGSKLSFNRGRGRTKLLSGVFVTLPALPSRYVCIYVYRYKHFSIQMLPQP